jgi:threonine/homoserine/homoserine lactone efflux protein
MELNLLFSFIGASVLLTLMPGPDNIFVLTESLTKGQRNGIAISTGLASGILIHTTAAATGLSILIQNSAIAFSILKYLGAAYLFYMAFGSLKDKQPVVELSSVYVDSEKSFFQLVRKGFFMNVLNPKVSLFFIAFLPQFVSKSGFHVSLQMIILGFIFMIQALLIFSILSMLSGKLSPYLNSSRFWRITKWSKISILSALGLTLLFARK